MITASDNKAAGRGLRAASATSGSQAVAHAAHMRALVSRRRAVRDPHHRRRPGAVLPARSTGSSPRATAPSPRAAARHHRPAAGGASRPSPAPATSPSSSRAAGARTSSTRPRYWSASAAGSRSRSSRAANRPPTGAPPRPASPRACWRRDGPVGPHPASEIIVTWGAGRSAHRFLDHARPTRTSPSSTICSSRSSATPPHRWARCASTSGRCPTSTRSTRSSPSGARSQRGIRSSSPRSS